MKKPETIDGEDLAVLKTVAQAWHAQASDPRPTTEFNNTHTSSQFKCKKLSRFKLEAMAMASKASHSNWDFAHSLLDSYEIVTLSKKLEANLALDRPIPSPPDFPRRMTESENSLRNLLQRTSS